VQRIERGTDGMVATMLADMGLLQVEVERWTLSGFATDYLSDAEDGDDWRDRWMDSWEINLRTGRPIRYEPGPTGLVGTVATDDTWSGDEPAPETCTVIADFARFREVEVALSVFARLARAEDGDDFVRSVHGHLQRAPESALRALWERQAEAPGPVTAAACRTHRQLHVSMAAGREFLEGGAKLAMAVEDLCGALGGTMRWRDRLT